MRVSPLTKLLLLLIVLYNGQWQQPSRGRRRYRLGLVMLRLVGLELASVHRRARLYGKGNGKLVCVCVCASVPLVCARLMRIRVLGGKKRSSCALLPASRWGRSVRKMLIFPRTLDREKFSRDWPERSTKNHLSLRFNVRAHSHKYTKAHRKNTVEGHEFTVHTNCVRVCSSSNQQTDGGAR